MRLIITILLALTSLCFSQDFWEQTNGPKGGIIQSLAVNPSGHIFAGTGYIDGLLFRSIDNGENWTKINNGLDIPWVTAIDINLEGHIFVGTTGIHQPSKTSGIFRSIDNGDNWEKINSGLWVYSLAINTSGHIFAGTWDGSIFRSVDNGNSWVKLYIGLDITSRNRVLSLTINESAHIFAGTESAGIFCSTDNGESWFTTNTGLPWVCALSVNSKGYIFAGSDHSVYRSTDSGKSWSFVTHIGGWGVSSLIINSEDCVFAGSEGIGVYYSTDNGNNWITINSGLTNYGVYSLAINSSDQIFTGTSDSLVFRSLNSVNWNNTTDIIESNSLSMNFTLVQNYPNPFNPSTTIKYTIPQSVISNPQSGERSLNSNNSEIPKQVRDDNKNVSLKIYDILGREVAILVNQKQNPGNYEVQFDANNLPSGVYFYQLTAGSFVETKKMILLR